MLGSNCCVAENLINSWVISEREISVFPCSYAVWTECFIEYYKWISNCFGVNSNAVCVLELSLLVFRLFTLILGLFSVCLLSLFCFLVKCMLVIAERSLRGGHVDTLYSGRYCLCVRWQWEQLFNTCEWHTLFSLYFWMFGVDACLCKCCPCVLSLSTIILLGVVNIIEMCYHLSYSSIIFYIIHWVADDLF